MDAMGSDMLNYSKTAMFGMSPGGMGPINQTQLSPLFDGAGGRTLGIEAKSVILNNAGGAPPIIITNNNVSQDNSANTTGQFNNGSSSPDANVVLAVSS